MDKEDYKELNNKVWEKYFDNEISPDELDKQLEDNYEEYRRYGQ